MLILLSVLTTVVIMMFVFYGAIKHTQPEVTTSTYLPRLSVKESEYIKTKRQECFEKYKDKLLWTNPQRKVDLCNPTILIQTK